MSYRHWTEEEIELLKKLYKRKKSIEYISNKLNRTPDAIKVYVKKHKGLVEHHKRLWTKEDDNKLMENWYNPRITINGIARNCGRTTKAIIEHAQILQLGPRPVADDMITEAELLKALHIGKKKLMTMINLGLKYHLAKSNRKYARLYDTIEVTEFLEKHQDLFDASLTDTNIFLQTPKWFKDKYIKDYPGNTVTISNTPWTKDEISKLKHYASHGYRDKEIATKINRTERAIRSYRLRLGIKSTIRYTDQEIETINNNYKDKTISEIAKMLPNRSYESVRIKIKKMKLKGELL